MKQLIAVLFCVLLLGCGTTPGFNTIDFRTDLSQKKDWPQETMEDFNKGKISIGMVKEQVFWIHGSPAYWTKYPTRDGVFESWMYIIPIASPETGLDSFDFKDGVLIGYSGNGTYLTKDGKEDVRDFKK